MTQQTAAGTRLPSVSDDGNGVVTIAAELDVTDNILAASSIFIGNALSLLPGGAIRTQRQSGDSNTVINFRADDLTGSAVFSVNVVGGLGLFGHVPPTAKTAVSQASIDAITDVDIRAVAQSLADALNSIGLITLA